MKHLIPEILDMIKYLPGIPANDVLRQKILQLREHAKTMEKENLLLRNYAKKLKQKVRKLEARIEELAGDTASNAKERKLMASFVEHKGALFKQQPGGRYDTVPYCPRCKVATEVSIHGTPFHCNTCGWEAGFDDTDLERIMSELEGAGDRFYF